MRKFLPSLILLCTGLVPVQASATLSCATPCTGYGPNVSSQPFYDVAMNCDTGQFTAGTGASHPITLDTGASQNVIFGGSYDSPGTSDMGFYVYNTDTFIESPPGGQSCLFDPADTMAEPANQGVETEWTLDPMPGLTLHAREEIVAFGTVADGSGVRLTLSISNDSASTVVAQLGMRWQIDFQNGPDDGPLFAPVICDPFAVGTEYSTEFEVPAADIQDFFRIQNNDYAPIFANFYSTAGVGGFSDTGVPDRLVYGNWGNLISADWFYTPSAVTADFDSAALYYYGDSAANAFFLAPGETFTRSIVMFTQPTAGAALTCGGFVTDPDCDLDGLFDPIDNCVCTANPDQEDSDGDGVGDACDPCPLDPTDDASDLDGACDDIDNCVGVANSDQADWDMDAVGDLCDICPFDPEDDADGDTICGDLDLCPDTVPDALCGNLKKNRWVLNDDGDWVFDTVLSTRCAREADGRTRHTHGSADPCAMTPWTIEDTLGCSCTQMLDLMAQDRTTRSHATATCKGDYKNGCSDKTIESFICMWIDPDASFCRTATRTP